MNKSTEKNSIFVLKWGEETEPGVRGGMALERARESEGVEAQRVTGRERQKCSMRMKAHARERGGHECACSPTRALGTSETKPVRACVTKMVSLYTLNLMASAPV